MRSRIWKLIFRITRLKLHWMPIKSIGTVPADNQTLSLFVTEIMRGPAKHRSSFLRKLIPISGYADADVQDESLTVTDRISKGDKECPGLIVQ